MKSILSFIGGFVFGVTLIYTICVSMYAFQVQDENKMLKQNRPNNQ